MRGAFAGQIASRGGEGGRTCGGSLFPENLRQQVDPVHCRRTGYQTIIVNLGSEFGIADCRNIDLLFYFSFESGLVQLVDVAVNAAL